jgi:hypothetical protein
MFLDDVADHPAFVPNLDVGMIDELMEADSFGLSLVVIAKDCAEHKRLHTSRPAELQKAASMRELGDEILSFFEAVAKPTLEL